MELYKSWKTSFYTHFAPPQPCTTLTKTISSNTSLQFTSFQHWKGERRCWHLLWGYRPFPHSKKQWHRVEVGVDRNTANVWKCPPEPRSGSIVRTHWSGMRERSIAVMISCFCAFFNTVHGFSLQATTLESRRKLDQVSSCSGLCEQY